MTGNDRALDAGRTPSLAEPARSRIRSWAAIAAIAVAWAVLWAAAFAATKVALRDAPSAIVVGVRCELAGCLLLVFFAHRLRGMGNQRLAGLTVLGLLNNTGYLGVMGFALHELSAGMAAILSACTPILVLVTSAALRQRRLGFLHIAGAALAFGGVSLSALDRMEGAEVLPTGVVWGAVAVLCLSAGTLLTPRLAGDLDVYAATGWQAAIGGLPLLGTALLLQPDVHFTGSALAAAAFLAIGGSIIGMALWLQLIRKVGPAQASIAHFLPPVLGVVLDATVFADPPTGRQVLSIAPLVTGVLLVTAVRSRR